MTHKNHYRPIPQNEKIVKHIPDINLMLSFHVETVVLLSQQKADDHISINLDLDELDLTSSEAEATYQEIKDYVLNTHNLKVSSLYIAQVKDKMGIKERINYNVSKQEDAYNAPSAIRLSTVFSFREKILIN